MAKKKAPQRLAGAEESCISPEQEAIIQWFRTVKFRKNLLGGVDEAAMWKKLEELYALYEAAIRAERTRYNVLLEQQTGSLPLDTAKVDSFAKGSPIRGAGAERLRGLAASSPLSSQMHWPLYASFSIAASGVRYSLQHSSYMREYSLLGLWCIRLLRVWES